MASKEEIQRELRAGRFSQNCGAVFRAFNMIDRQKFIPLRDMRLVVKDLGDQEFLDCINFLQLAEYILIRHRATRELVDIGDYPVEELESKRSEKGIRFAHGDFDDPIIDY